MIHRMFYVSLESGVSSILIVVGCQRLLLFWKETPTFFFNIHTPDSNLPTVFEGTSIHTIRVGPSDSHLRREPSLIISVSHSHKSAITSFTSAVVAFTGRPYNHTLVRRRGRLIVAPFSVVMSIFFITRWNLSTFSFDLIWDFVMMTNSPLCLFICNGGMGIFSNAISCSHLSTILIYCCILPPYMRTAKPVPSGNFVIIARKGSSVLLFVTLPLFAFFFIRLFLLEVLLILHPGVTSDVEINFFFYLINKQESFDSFIVATTTI